MAVEKLKELKLSVWVRDDGWACAWMYVCGDNLGEILRKKLVVRISKEVGCNWEAATGGKKGKTKHY